MNKTTLAITAFALAFAFVSPLQHGSAQLGNPECDAAAKWHLREALRWSQTEAQVFHLHAATAAERLAASAGNCDGWRQDAGPATYDVNTGNWTMVVAS